MTVEIIIEEQTNEQREKQINRILQLLKFDLNKKLEFIQYYLQYQRQLEVGISDKDALMNFLRSEEATDEILAEIFDLLDQSFSRGYPNYIFEFELEHGTSKTDLINYIEQAFPTENKLSPRGQNFTYISRIGPVQNNYNDNISFKVQYERHREVQTIEGIEQGALEVKSSFDIIFDFISNCCYIQCGDKKILSTIEKLINTHLTILERFDGYSLRTKQESTMFEGEIKLDKQTIIILDFIENEINDCNHEINDYLGTTFFNNRSDKVKSVKLRGTNLLESFEVADRVRNGDKIKSVRFQLRVKTGEDRYIIPTINLDFDDPLKITFGNIENTSYIPQLINHLRTKLDQSLSKRYQANEVLEELQHLIQRARTKDSMIVINILATIKEEFLKIEDENKEEYIRIIDRYLLGGE